MHWMVTLVSWGIVSWAGWQYPALFIRHSHILSNITANLYKPVYGLWGQTMVSIEGMYDVTIRWNSPPSVKLKATALNIDPYTIAKDQSTMDIHMWLESGLLIFVCVPPPPSSFSTSLQSDFTLTFWPLCIIDFLYLKYYYYFCLL